jgi:hypothetical protein
VERVNRVELGSVHTGKGVNRMTKDNDESVIVSLINDEVRPSVALI